MNLLKLLGTVNHEIPIRRLHTDGFSKYALEILLTPWMFDKVLTKM